MRPKSSFERAARLGDTLTKVSVAHTIIGGAVVGHWNEPTTEPLLRRVLNGVRKMLTL